MPLPEATDVLSIACATTPLGALCVAVGPQGIADVSLGDDEASLRADLAARWPEATWADTNPAAADALTALRAHLVAPAAPPRLTLDLRGTDFQRIVWRALQHIPPGTTWTYTTLAERVGRPDAVRAVAAACAANRHAVVVPCHRVVGHDGSLTGYRWGVERKRALLALEGAPAAAQGLLFG